MIGRLTRKPVAICGEQAGKITCQIILPRDKPKVLAVFNSTQQTCRTPSIVLSRIGQANEKNITKIFNSSSSPKNSIATGITTGGGTGRNTSTTTSSTR